jgi:hypothetical protein
MSEKINPECPKCHLISIIFDFNKLPMQCQYCGNELEEIRTETDRYFVDGVPTYSAKDFHEKLKKKYDIENIREKLIDIILKVAMKHHDDISKSDEDAACNAADEILATFPQIQLPLGLVDKDGECYYCGEKTNSIAGNPSGWCVFLCHSDDPGKVKHHHVGCVTQRLKEYEKLKELHRMQAELSNNDIAFWGSDWNVKHEFIGIKFCVICSDVFAWGTADAEELKDDELKFVYNIYIKYKEIGVAAWCSLKRNKLEPQEAYLEQHKDFFKIRDEIEKMQINERRF